MSAARVIEVFADWQGLGGPVPTASDEAGVPPRELVPPMTSLWRVAIAGVDRPAVAATA